MSSANKSTISVYAWICIAGAILFVLITSAILLKTMRGRRFQKKQQRIEEGNAMFGSVLQNPVQKPAPIRKQGERISFHMYPCNSVRGMLGVIVPNLITGLVVMLLLLFSLLGGIYGTIKHRERNKKKRLQSIAKHEVAKEQARQAKDNVEMEMREEEKRKRTEGVVDMGKVEQQNAGVDEDRGRSRRAHEESGTEKQIETEIGEVKVTLNGIKVDLETRREPGAVIKDKHVVEIGANELDPTAKVVNVLSADEEQGQTPMRKKRRNKWSIYGKR